MKEDQPQQTTSAYRRAAKFDRWLNKHAYVSLLIKAFAVVGAVSGVFGFIDDRFLAPARNQKAAAEQARREGRDRPPHVEVVLSGGRCEIRNRDTRDVLSVQLGFREMIVNPETCFGTRSTAFLTKTADSLPPRKSLETDAPTRCMPKAQERLNFCPESGCVQILECEAEYVREADRWLYASSRYGLRVVDADGGCHLEPMEMFVNVTVEDGRVERWRDASYQRLVKCAEQLAASHRQARIFERSEAERASQTIEEPPR